jgi:hypothetical protein
MGVGATAWTMPRWIEGTYNLTTYPANPTHSNLAHKIRTADDSNHFPILNDRYPSDALVGQEMLDLFDFGVGAHTDDTPRHDFFDGTSFFGNQVMFGDEANQHAMGIDNRQTTDPVARHQTGRVFNSGIIVDANHIAGHDLARFHSELPFVIFSRDIIHENSCSNNSILV